MNGLNGHTGIMACTLLKKGCYDSTFWGEGWEEGGGFITSYYRCVSFMPKSELCYTPSFDLIGVVGIPIGCRNVVTMHIYPLPLVCIHIQTLYFIINFTTKSRTVLELCC